MVDWITDKNDAENAPIDNETYLVTIKNNDKVYVDYIEYYNGEWCTQNTVIAWAKIEPYLTD